MAQLYPENRDKEEFTSEAEFLIYEEFKKNLDKLPSSLKIYHSAVWAKKAYQIKEEKEHQRHPNKEGECDFVLVDQDLGAVFIEVKGGTIKRDEKNTWTTTTRYGKEIKLKKSPFEQARLSMHYMLGQVKHDWLKHNANPMHDYFHNHVVFFPETKRKSENTDLGFEADDSNQIAYAEDLQGDKFSGTILTLFRDHSMKADRLGKEGADLFHNLYSKPLKFERDLIAKIHQNEFYLNSENSLTAQQSKSFSQLLSAQKRLWIMGPAGSGKTYLAMERIKEFSEDGLSGWYLCSGELMCAKVERNVQHSIAGLRVGTYQEFQDFIQDSSEEQVDYIIVDEAQDFEEEQWLEMGSYLTEETWFLVFGDSAQSLWRLPEAPSLVDGMPKAFPLKDVLRYGNQIANKSLCVINKPADAFELKGPKHDEVYLHSSANLYEDVIKEFNRLNVFEGIEKSKIATLFLHDNTNKFKELYSKNGRRSCHSGDDILNPKIIDGMYVESVYNFKGLEADCVILVIDSLSNDKKLLEELYVGITRARTYLSIFCNETEVQKLSALLESNFVQYKR